MYRNLVFLAFALTFVVVVFGAYVQLNDAGLGCPDWPGCYGHAAVPQADTQRAAAAAKFPGAGLEPRKAWIEMIHRYLAGTLGLMILAIAILAWCRPQRSSVEPKMRGAPWLQTMLAALVAFQAAL
jgi:cytochrome c oxidase assembly protein subunit 15